MQPTEANPQQAATPLPRGLVCIILPAIALGLYVRFAHLDRQVYRYDEAKTSLRVAGYSESDLARTLPHGRPFPIEAFAPYRHVDSSTSAGQIITKLAVEQPHQSPAYAILAWEWARKLGDSVGWMRALSATISVFAAPAFFWLARELGGDRRVAWTAVGLLAVSPIHVIYAHEARPYSLWIVSVLLCCAALLHALRTGARTAWMVYAFMLAFALYSQLLTLWVAIAHSVYVVGRCGVRWTRPLRSYVGASIGAGALFAPWAVNFLGSQTEAASRMEWVEHHAGFAPWIKTVILNFACIVFDARLRPDNVLYYSALPVLGIIAWACWYLIRTAPRTMSLFVIALAVIPVLALAIPDVLFDGSRLMVARYALPSYVALQLALAWGLSVHLDGRRQRWWLGALAALLCAGAVSCVYFVRADTWWSRGFGQYNRQVACMLGAADRPLVISDWDSAVFALSYAIDRDVSVLLVPSGEAPVIPPGYGDVFVFTTLPGFTERLRAAGFEVEPAYAPGELERLRRHVGTP